MHSKLVPCFPNSSNTLFQGMKRATRRGKINSDVAPHRTCGEALLQRRKMLLWQQRRRFCGLYRLPL